MASRPCESLDAMLTVYLAPKLYAAPTCDYRWADLLHERAPSSLPYPSRRMTRAHRNRRKGCRPFQTNPESSHPLRKSREEPERLRQDVRLNHGRQMID